MRSLTLIAVLLSSAFAAAETPAGEWPGPDAIIEAIQLPKIPDTDFPITNFGVALGGAGDATEAIRAAIAAASSAGGGRVVIPAGTWVSKGPIHLSGRIELHLAQGSELMFSPEPAHYLPVVKTRWQGTEVMTYSPLIYAANVEDVAITGAGIINGNKDSGFRAWASEQQDDVQQLRKMGAQGTPLEQRIFAEGTHLRPPLIQVFNVKRVLFDGFSTRNSPFWIHHLTYASHVTIRNLTVEGDFQNNDGIDIESSSYVLVENNRFRTRGAALAFKSGRDQDGRTIALPSEHVVIRNNDIGSEDGIAFGTEMSGGIRNIHVLDNILRTGSTALRFSSSLDRGGLVEHIRVRNLKAESFKNLFSFQLNYPAEMGGNFPSTYRDIVFENFEVDNANTFLEVRAPAATPLTDVTFRNIQVKKVNAPLTLENALGIRFENVTLGEQSVDGELSWRKRMDAQTGGSKDRE